MGDAEPLHIRAGRRLRKRWRAWLRAIHRDVGYLIIGLTVIYAVSGLAINHVGDWDPNYDRVEETVVLGPLPDDEAEATREVLDALGVDETPSETFMAAGRLEIYFQGGNRSVLAATDTGTVRHDYKEPRFFLRIANWLHENRGKEAWTYIADIYAILLLYLAISGMFMLKGRLGLGGRGIVLISLGAGVPIVYVVLSGGPGG